MKYSFVPVMLTGAAHQLKGRLYRLEPARKADATAPDWTGGDRVMQTENPKAPLVNPEEWQGRWVLAPLQLRSADGQTTLTLNDAVVRVERASDIVTSRMAGMDGTVKEFVGHDDWQVEMAIGLQATDDDGHIVDDYPETAVRDLTAMLSAGKEIQVSSKFLQLFHIDQIVVTRYSIEQDTASNYQAVTVEARSDQDYNLLAAEY